MAVLKTSWYLEVKLENAPEGQLKFGFQNPWKDFVVITSAGAAATGVTVTDNTDSDGTYDILIDIVALIKGYDRYDDYWAFITGSDGYRNFWIEYGTNTVGSGTDALGDITAKLYYDLDDDEWWEGL